MITVERLEKPHRPSAPVPRYPPIVARVLSAALSTIAPQGATADVNGIETFPGEVEVNAASVNEIAISWPSPEPQGARGVVAGRGGCHRDIAIPLTPALKGLGSKGPVGPQCFRTGGDARDHLARSMAAWRKMCPALDP